MGARPPRRAWPSVAGQDVGEEGLHVYAPRDDSWHYADSRAFARALAGELAAAHPALIADRIVLSERQARVLIDWRQNAVGLSTVAPYSLRALPWPLVSTPLGWSEVESALAAGGAAAPAFTPRAGVDRPSAHRIAERSANTGAARLPSPTMVPYNAGRRHVVEARVTILRWRSAAAGRVLHLVASD